MINDPRPIDLFRRSDVLGPCLYLAGAVVVWLDFVSAEPDGLANLGLVIYTIPIVIVGTYCMRGQFPYVAGDYFEAHAWYFWSSSLILTCLLFVLLHFVKRLANARAASDADDELLRSASKGSQHLNDKDRR